MANKTAPAIDFAKVSKRFRLNSERNSSVLDTIVSSFSKSDVSGNNRQVLWALRDLSFRIMPGECVGLVGDNGSGKSTLLKVASGIIRPSAGRVMIRGRLSALLELGAGFQPDLTGKENIWLNASILGMTNSDITQIYNDIVEFSELGEFINMPVKHYSSGMYMRLGFSVAVHVQPDVLLIDEILAVGDQSFQNKCIRRLHQLNQQGVTVVFVSHTLETVRALCNRIFWIVDGKIVEDGEIDAVINRYLASHNEINDHVSDKDKEQFQRWGTEEIKVSDIRLLDDVGTERGKFQEGQSVTVEISYQASLPIENAEFGLAFIPKDASFGYEQEYRVNKLNSSVNTGSGTLRCHIKQLPLVPDDYSITATVYDSSGTVAFDHFERAKTFEVSAKSGDLDDQEEIIANWETIDKGNSATII